MRVGNDVAAGKDSNMIVLYQPKGLHANQERKTKHFSVDNLPVIKVILKLKELVLLWKNVACS